MMRRYTNTLANATESCYIRNMKSNPHTKRPPRICPFQDMRPFYFITFNTADRAKILNTPAVHDAFLSFCRTAYDNYGIAVGCYVIMPDHIHFFVVMPPETDLPRWIATLKMFLGKHIEKKPAWQRGFFDHLMRNRESYSQKWDYVRENPVRAGLCQTSEQWIFQGEFIPLMFD